jgi:hypothetical protein
MVLDIWREKRLWVSLSRFLMGGLLDFPRVLAYVTDSLASPLHLFLLAAGYSY